MLRPACRDGVAPYTVFHSSFPSDFWYLRTFALLPVTLPPPTNPWRVSDRTTLTSLVTAYNCSSIPNLTLLIDPISYSFGLGVPDRPGILVFLAPETQFARFCHLDTHTRLKMYCKCIVWTFCRCAFPDADQRRPIISLHTYFSTVLDVRSTHPENLARD